jgi:hypothetical protein
MRYWADSLAKSATDVRHKRALALALAARGFSMLSRLVPEIIKRLNHQERQGPGAVRLAPATDRRRNIAACDRNFPATKEKQSAQIFQWFQMAFIRRTGS